MAHPDLFLFMLHYSTDEGQPLSSIKYGLLYACRNARCLVMLQHGNGNLVFSCPQLGNAMQLTLFLEALQAVSQGGKELHNYQCDKCRQNDDLPSFKVLQTLMSSADISSSPFP